MLVGRIGHCSTSSTPLSLTVERRNPIHILNPPCPQFDMFHGKFRGEISTGVRPSRCLPVVRNVNNARDGASFGGLGVYER
jgi:hypothetical protein